MGGRAVSLLLIPQNRKEELFELFENYLNEFSLISGGNFTKSAEQERELLNSYWEVDNRFAYFITSFDNKTIGFVLVNDYCENETRPPKFSIAEFYIAPIHRMKGVGKDAATKIFQCFQGYWEVRVQHYNTEALKFWRNTISFFTKGDFTEVEFGEANHKGKCILFRSSISTSTLI